MIDNKSLFQVLLLHWKFLKESFFRLAGENLGGDFDILDFVAVPLGEDFVSLVDCLGESDGIVFSIEHGVVKLHEDVAENEHVFVVVGGDGERHHIDMALFGPGKVLNPVVRG